MTSSPAPPFDPELSAVLTAAGFPSTITPDMIPMLRQGVPFDTTESLLADNDIVAEEHTIPGYQGAEIVVSVLKKRHHTGLGPGVLHTHGGGMVSGDRWTGVFLLVPWIVQHDAVAVTVEYRLAPEFPDPVPVEDCYAALVWTAEHAAELGLDPARLVITGASAGGGLAAGVSLLARDRGGPALLAQVLVCPMIDDRDATTSAGQIDGIGVWDRGSNMTGWTALLGERRGTDDVSIYAAPARATDLGGLPPAYIDAGSAEVFRDEDVAYASGIWAAGGSAELHIWAGGFHGFEGFAPHAALSVSAAATRNAWVARILGQ